MVDYFDDMRDHLTEDEFDLVKIHKNDPQIKSLLGEYDDVCKEMINANKSGSSDKLQSLDAEAGKIAKQIIKTLNAGKSKGSLRRKGRSKQKGRRSARRSTRRRVKRKSSRRRSKRRSSRRSSKRRVKRRSNRRRVKRSSNRRVKRRSDRRSRRLRGGAPDESVPPAPEPYQQPTVEELVVQKGEELIKKLMKAAKDNNIEELKTQLELVNKYPNVDVNSANVLGETALHHASRNTWVVPANRDPPGSMHILVNAGANVNLAAEDGETPLMVATANENIPGIKYLLEKGADVSAEKKNGKCKTAMSIAVRDENTTIQKILNDALEIQKESSE
tara:strand:+ start:240 stop:1235 length:996 start_codon:yes stop_codon:yes gene_type:complete